MAGGEALYLVEEGVAWVDELFGDLGEDIKTELDHFVILLHSFLVELGFSPEDGGIHPPPGWRSSNGVYLLKYLLHPSKTPTCQLIVTKLGESVLKVHGIHLQDKTTYTLSSLKISNHIKTVDNKFQATNLQLLSRSFKNAVGLPLLQTSRSHLGLPITGLLGLPPEILLGILRFLPVEAIINISESSKQLNDASKDQSIWKNLCKKDFPGKDSKDWRETYKQEHIAKKHQEKEREALRNRRPEPPVFPYPDPLNPEGGPALPIIPGMLGGDYDRFPLGGGMGPLGGGMGPLGGGHGPLGGGGPGPLGGGGPGPLGGGGPGPLGGGGPGPFGGGGPGPLGGGGPGPLGGGGPGPLGGGGPGPLGGGGPGPLGGGGPGPFGGGGPGPLGGGGPGPLGGGGPGPLGGGGPGPLGGGGLGPFGRGRGPRFDPPGPNFPNMGPGFGRGNPMGFGGGGFGFM